MKIRCSLTLAETTFADEEHWSRCWSKCFLKCWLSAAWRADPGAVWWFDEVARRLHPTLKRLGALAGLRCQKCSIWHWDGQMHWRVFGFLSVRLHPTLRRLDALAGFRIFTSEATPNAEAVGCIGGFSDFYQWGCIWHWGSQMHWRVFGFACYRTVRLQAIDDARNAASDAEAVRCIDGFSVFS